MSTLTKDDLDLVDRFFAALSEMDSTEYLEDKLRLIEAVKIAKSCVYDYMIGLRNDMEKKANTETRGFKYRFIALEAIHGAMENLMKSRVKEITNKVEARLRY